MNFRRFAAIAILVLSSYAATNVAPSKSELEGMYDKAFRAFDSSNFAQALKELDVIDARQPDLAESQNLRGVILMRQGRHDEAEAALKKALDVDPKFWNARFNLAEIPFLKKDWTEARNRFEALLADNPPDLQGDAAQLIQYKILLTFLLEGKENMVQWIMDKFEVSTDTPALYYANAALALHHKNAKEAKDWMSAADKTFSSQLNKLFAESFYEVGWMEKPAGQSRAALEITSAAERAARLKADARAKYEMAERAFQQRDFNTAITRLDEADVADPNQAASLNLRGEVLMEQREFEKAETAFKKAFKADPKFREAQYNLAQIPFKKKEYGKSRDRLEALFGETPLDEKNQAAQLIKFKIFMTLLLEGKDSRAQKMMEQFQFTGDTPALYYAQAAWEFKHSNPGKGNDWVASARKIYAPPLNIVFADSFYDLGWLPKGDAVAAAPPAAALAQAESTPPAQGAPAMRFGSGTPMPALVLAESEPAKDLQPMQPSVVTAPSASPALVVAKNVAAPPVMAAALPANTPASTAAPVAISATSVAAPIAAAAVNSPVPKPVLAPAPVTGSRVAMIATAPIARPVVTAPAAIRPTTGAVAAAIAAPVTTLAPARIREWSQPSFSELLDRISNPQALTMGALLLAGLGLLLWLVTQQIRRHLSTSEVLIPNSISGTEPQFLGPGAIPMIPATGQRQIKGGPPQASLKLKASETSPRRRVAAPIPEVAKPAVVEEPEFEVPKSAEYESKAEGSNVPAAMPESAVVVGKVESPMSGMHTETESGSRKLTETGTALADDLVAPSPLPPVDREESSSLPSSSEVLATAVAAELAAETTAPTPVHENPVRQGQPVPYQTPPETVESIAVPEDKIITLPRPAAPIAPANLLPASADAEVAKEPAMESTIAAPLRATSFTEPPAQQPISHTKMPEPTTTTPAPETKPTPIAAAVPQPSGGPQHTSVQLTFSFEIASLQLTPSFKMGALQLKPTSKVVSMRLTPSQQPQPAMNLQVTFEIATVTLAAGNTIGAIRLTPSQQQKPTVLTTPHFEITGLQLVSSFESAPVQLTPSQQGQASVQVTASFQIATVEFTPSFEIASVLLNSTSRNVAVQLPGAGPSSIEGAPVFEIGSVQLTGASEIGMLQLNPLGTATAKS